MYTCLYLDIWRGYKPANLHHWLLTLPVAAFGGIIEILQHTMGIGRGGDVVDLVADCAGILMIALCLQLMRAQSIVRSNSRDKV